MSQTLALDAAADVVRQLPDNGLSKSRSDALDLLAEQKLPGPRDEDWKYTDLRDIVQVSNDWLNKGGGSTVIAEEAIDAVSAGLDIDWLIVRNGHVDASELAKIKQPGLHIEPLSTGATLRPSDSALLNLNTALLQDGISISVDANSHCTRTIAILCIDHVATSAGSSQTRVDINLGANSSASFVEYHVSSGAAAHYANSVVELNLAAGASADFLRIQERGDTHSQTGLLRAQLAEKSQLTHGAFDFGGKLIRNDLQIDINGRDAQVDFCGLYLANEGQHIDNHTRVDHRVGPASSHQEYRGILHGRSRCVWNGKAIVHAGADGTDANQANHNLLLTERCEVDAKPELEIYADDVKCSHGTTVGQLDETALFYLRTRGIDDATARQLLTRAFAETIVAAAPVAVLHERLSDRVAMKLANMSSGEVE